MSPFFMELLKAEKLTKIHRKGFADETTALLEVSFSVEAGSCVLLSGPSGSGKTTLLSLLACLSRPTSGKYFFDGQQVSSMPEKFLTLMRRQKIGMVFQHFNLIENLTVEQNIILGLLPEGLSAKALISKAHQAAERVSISHKIKSLARFLSGGEKQRVAIARAIVSDPPLICADEPTAHLDRETAGEILKEFEALKSQAKTLIITSHDSFLQNHPILDSRLELVSGRLL
jgi:putative ABC transport system ATP-binding protein